MRLEDNDVPARALAGGDDYDQRNADLIVHGGVDPRSSLRRSTCSLGPPLIEARHTNPVNTSLLLTQV